MQAAAAGLPAPGPGPVLPPPRVKISPPIFKGLPGERPEAHLLRANDWMDTYNILPVNKPANFKHTLNHLAREWYDSLTFHIAWDDLQQRFSRYFSTQGRSIKHLHDKWRNFSFTPGQDDIEAYIRDVKEAAHQLNYNDEAVLHLIKATMPSKIYGTLYNQHDLNTVITMVKDIYAKKPKPANPPATTGGVVAPFTLIKAPNGSSKRVHFQECETLSDRIDKLTETLYRMDMEGKPTKKPYKPYITSPRHRGGRGDLDPGEVVPAVSEAKDGPDQKVDSKAEEEDFPTEEDSREGSLTRAPLQRGHMYPASPKIKIKTNVIIAIKGDTSQPIALREIRPSLQSLPKEKGLRIIRTPMGVQKTLSWLQPWPCPKPMKKLSPLCDNP